MGRSLKLFTFLGIPVYLHWTFALIFVYILYHAWSTGLDTHDTLWLTGMFLSVFVCVVLHEFGHAIAARRYGVKTRDIVLLPIGGMARLERMPEKPWQELVVAVAGPLVNVIIAFFLITGIALMITPEEIEVLQAAMMSEMRGDAIEQTGIKISETIQFLTTLAFSNIILVLFNMLPVFPMDGGRVLRALLSMWVGRPRATMIASFIGIAFAACFVVYGIYQGQFTLALLGLFVILSARTENNFVQVESTLGKYKVRDAMRREFTRLPHTTWMEDAIDALYHGLERNFLVVNFQDEILGSLNEREILLARKRKDSSTPVTEYMRQTTTIHQDQPMTQAYALIFQRRAGIVPVVDDTGLIVGVIDAVGLSYFLSRLAE